jgi:hypothetical protein
MKSMTCRSYPHCPQFPVDNFDWGGRGWSLVVIIVGATAIPKKRNWKNPIPQLAHQKKEDYRLAICYSRPLNHAHNDKDNREDRANGQHPR